ncbi:MAG TPA: N-acetylmuramoyl-L-alanine amidase [Longimicrobium sp.]|uniref:N-acetylmuramoyl-L-alanine amidase n=1 Tax=Longimicrobium sp. TaxID=2029185 RepID=UPI002EDAA724
MSDSVAGDGRTWTQPVIRNALPAIPARTGPLRIDLPYPGEGYAVSVADSNFIFGSVGTGGATLTINGAPVQVAPNGAFLAFLPVPRDGLYRLEAVRGSERAGLQRRVRVPALGTGPGETGIVAGSVTPAGTLTGVEGERITVRFRGAAGGRAVLLLPDGRAVPLVERRVVERAEAFMQERAVAAREVTEYAGSFALTQPIAFRDTAARAPTLVGADPGARSAVIEFTHSGRTTQQPLALASGVLRAGETRTGVAASGRAEGNVIGTAIPGSGTPYEWFFPNGTRFTIDGEREGAYRVRLSRDQSVWVPAADVRLEPAGAPPVAGTVGTVRLEPAAEWTDVRVVTSDRLPFEVHAEERALEIRVYGAETRTNWLQYGATDPMVRRAEWRQEADDRYVVRLELNQPVWGWRSFWDASGALVVRVRRAPPIDAGAPMRGLRIALDAGHPPGGAIGPTGLTEAEANLAITKRLVTMLRTAGAEVIETRPDPSPVDLGARPLQAAQQNAHLLVSIHNNAFPDGVNPMENNGTTVFYNHAPSLDLARRMQAELVAELGLRDLGVARADLALVRPTWMPSVLTETMFLMVPQQEAALRDPAVHERIARAHFRAIEGYLRARAGR